MLLASSCIFTFGASVVLAVLGSTRPRRAGTGKTQLRLLQLVKPGGVKGKNSRSVCSCTSSWPHPTAPSRSTGTSATAAQSFPDFPRICPRTACHDIQYWDRTMPMSSAVSRSRSASPRRSCVHQARASTANEFFGAALWALSWVVVGKSDKESFSDCRKPRISPRQCRDTRAESKRSWLPPATSTPL